MAYTSVRVEAALEIPGISMELIDFRWEDINDSVRHNSGHVVALCLSPLDLKSLVKLGDTNFRTRGKISFAPAQIGFVSRSFGGQAKFALCKFSPDRFKDLLGGDEQWVTSALMKCIDIQNPTISRCIYRLVDEATSPQLGSEVVLEAMGNLIMVELSRHFFRYREGRDLQRGGLAPWQMHRLDEYIRECHGKVLSADLARICGTSLGHLRRAFKQSTGMTLHDHIEEIRLSQAKHLLSSSDISLKQISALLGFSNPSGLSIAFKRLVGISPKEYRQRMYSVNSVENMN